MTDSSTARIWYERGVSVLSRALLFGGVLPRAYAASRAAARRSEESGIPSWHLGAREFGETATDELFIALSAVYRQVPHLDDVRASVARCAQVAPGLEPLGVAGAHHAPPPLHLLGLRRRKVMGIAHEHLEFQSAPVLPAALADLGYGTPEVAHARVLRHAEGPRPWVVFVHGAEQGRWDDLFAFRAQHLHHELGLNVAMPVLPVHGPRRELGRSWPGFDILDNVTIMMRAVSDVRSVIDWIHTQPPASEPTSVTAVGMSLGGPVAALVAGLDERVDGVAAMVPMLDAHATIAHHLAKTGGRGRTLAALLRDDAVRAVSSIIDPVALEPHAVPDRRLVVAALGDRMTSVQAAQRLHTRWRGQVHWYPGGHILHLASGEVREKLDEFLGREGLPQER